MLSAEAFEQGLTLLKATWPREDWPEARIQVYLMTLADLSDSLYIAAIGHCLQTARFLPKPAEIRDAATALLEASGQLPLGPEAAWELIIGDARYWTEGKRLTVGEPLVDEALRAIGGLRAVALAEPKELSFLRRDFLAAYTVKRDVAIALGGGLQQQLAPGKEQTPALAG